MKKDYRNVYNKRVIKGIRRHYFADIKLLFNTYVLHERYIPQRYLINT